MSKKRKPKRKNYVITYEVKLRGSTIVKATDPGTAREDWLNAPEIPEITYTSPAGGPRAEMTDWTCLDVEEET